MNDLKKAARMALKGLEKTKDENTAYLDFKEPYHEAITALRQALSNRVEQPAIVSRAEEAYEAAKQREWVGLTEEEREEATGWSVKHIEAKLREKNTGETK